MNLWRKTLCLVLKEVEAGCRMMVMKAEKTKEGRVVKGEGMEERVMEGSRIKDRRVMMG